MHINMVTVFTARAKGRGAGMLDRFGPSSRRSGGQLAKHGHEGEQTSERGHGAPSHLGRHHSSGSWAVVTLTTATSLLLALTNVPLCEGPLENGNAGRLPDTSVVNPEQRFPLRSFLSWKPPGGAFLGTGRQQGFLLISPPPTEKLFRCTRAPERNPAVAVNLFFLMASTCVAGPAGQTDLPRLLLVSDARHGAAQAALGWGALPHSCWERLKMGDTGGLLSLPGLQWKGNDACRGEEGKRSSLSGACIVHARLYSALGLSLAERLTPLMRHGVKNGEVQKGDGAEVSVQKQYHRGNDGSVPNLALVPVTEIQADTEMQVWFLNVHFSNAHPLSKCLVGALGGCREGSYPRHNEWDSGAHTLPPLLPCTLYSAFSQPHGAHCAVSWGPSGWGPAGIQLMELMETTDRESWHIPDLYRCGVEVWQDQETRLDSAISTDQLSQRKVRRQMGMRGTAGSPEEQSGLQSGWRSRPSGASRKETSPPSGLTKRSVKYVRNTDAKFLWRHQAKLDGQMHMLTNTFRGLSREQYCAGQRG
ncbi:hypothetical protein Anapl_11078 [Anas platyrhynchos]|uniref:Uncharacterized protein n=1 Tax=Anas platyrhynchos TaxID=8839 RepID=R0LSR2_ANAPL|nr:hypothetical protein Anapl_11078 [Anas platyrhynchos]